GREDRRAVYRGYRGGGWRHGRCLHQEGERQIGDGALAGPAEICTTQAQGFQMTQVVVVRQPGGPEVLTLEDWPVAEPGLGQVALRQTAIGLNFVDTYQRGGLYPTEVPFVAGNEGAGVVTAVGEGVTGFKIGDRVAYQAQIGAYAAERLVMADRIVPVPDSIDD